MSTLFRMSSSSGHVYNVMSMAYRGAWNKEPWGCGMEVVADGTTKGCGFKGKVKRTPVIGSAILSCRLEEIQDLNKVGQENNMHKVVISLASPVLKGLTKTNKTLIRFDDHINKSQVARHEHHLKPVVISDQYFIDKFSCRYR